MSKEFKPKDRVSINKDLTYTAPRFGVGRKMRENFTGTVTHNLENDEVNEIIVMSDYPESDRIAHSYDARDLTLISRRDENESKTEEKENPMSKFRVVVDKSLRFTKKRFGTTYEMRTIFTGAVSRIDEKNNEAVVSLDGSHYHWTYDLRDLTPSFPTPTNVKTSNETTTVEFSDNTTTSVKKSADDPYDLETAIAYCIAKKLVTNSYIKHLAKNAEEVIDKVNTEFYNKFLKPYGFLNESAYSDVEIETLKDYLKTLNDVRSDLALIAIENNLTKDELLGKLS